MSQIAETIEVHPYLSPDGANPNVVSPTSVTIPLRDIVQVWADGSRTAIIACGLGKFWVSESVSTIQTALAPLQ